jgi:hypothetical protein
VTEEDHMSGKLPIDRAREAQDDPPIYDEHRERFREHEAALRDADDPVSGARPETDAPSEPFDDETVDQAGIRRD